MKITEKVLLDADIAKAIKNCLNDTEDNTETTAKTISHSILLGFNHASISKNEKEDILRRIQKLLR